MKRIVAVFDEKSMPDLTSLMNVAVEFKIETLENAKPAVTRYRPGGGKTALSTVMEHYTPQGTMTKQTMTSWLTKAGYKPNTFYSVLSEAKSKALIRDLGKDKYQFLVALPPSAAAE